MRRIKGEESVSGKVTVSVQLGIIATMPQNETLQNDDAAWWHPEIEDRADFLVRRADMVKSIREFFDRNGYVEVETPTLQISPGMEPHLSPFQISSLDPQGGRRQMYLHTSPEFAMKKLLAAGMQRIFQVARVFRDGSGLQKHHPEFTMLEWYRVGADWRALADETAEFVRAVCGPAARFGDHDSQCRRTLGVFVRCRRGGAQHRYRSAGDRTRSDEPRYGCAAVRGGRNRRPHG